MSVACQHPCHATRHYNNVKMTANIVGPCGAALNSLVIELELPVKCSGMHQQETIAVVEL